MSYTATYELYKTKVLRIGEHRNSYGSAIALWDYISQRYLGKRFTLSSNNDDFWPVWKDSRLSREERMVLLSTYDRSFIEKEHLQEYADACRVVHDLILEYTDWTWNHFNGIADDAENLTNSKQDRRLKGMCITCTSVCDDWMGDVKSIKAWGIFEEMKLLGVMNDR